MKFTYDQVADALYIQLQEKTVARSQRVNFNMALDMDGNGEVIGVEILNVCKRGLNPYELTAHFVTPEATVEPPNTAEIEAGRAHRKPTGK